MFYIMLNSRIRPNSVKNHNSLENYAMLRDAWCLPALSSLGLPSAYSPNFAVGLSWNRLRSQMYVLAHGIEGFVAGLAHDGEFGGAVEVGLGCRSRRGGSGRRKGRGLVRRDGRRV
jgi:hypothetical protein